MRVVLPSPLAGYSAGRREVEASGATLAEALSDLDRQFPGIAFRVVDEQGAIRPHIKFFVNREMVRTLSVRLAAGDEILVVAALSGGWESARILRCVTIRKSARGRAVVT